VQILLDSAHDVGDPGVDAIYGRGILNMARALAPSGATSLAGTTSTLSLSASTAAGSAAMGDALGTTSLGTVMLDGYKRAYRVDLARGLRSAPLMPRLTARLAARQQGFAGTLANASFAFTVDGQGVRPNLSGANPLQLDAQDAEAARVLAARVALRLSPATQIGFAHAESADGLAVQMRGADRPAFFMARHALADMGFEAENGLAVALRHQMGGWGITASAQAGRVLSDAPLEVFQRLRAERQREAMASFGVAADRQFGPLKAAFGLTWLAEDNTILGARFHDALGGKGADTLFADAEAGWAFAPGWQVTGAFRQGWSRTRGGGVIVAGSQFASRGWSVDVERQGVLGTKDRLGLRLAQPLRVERGGLSLDLPVGYDYASGAATNAVTRLNLAPEGRELMGELHWGGPLWAGWGSAGVFYRREPGHFAALPDDKGMAIRWQGAF